MVSELDLSGHDEVNIAQMIDGEISALIPDWKSGSHVENNPYFPIIGDFLNPISNFTSNDYLKSHNRTLSTCTVATHGRFEEIFCDHENGSELEVMDDAPSVEFSSSDPKEIHSEDEYQDMNLKESPSTLITTVCYDSSKLSRPNAQKDDEKRNNGMLPSSYFYDNEKCQVDRVPRERQRFPKIGSLKIQGYEENGFSGRITPTLSFSSFSCLPRTSSARVDDTDAWRLYYDFLHTSF